MGTELSECQWSNREGTAKIIGCAFLGRFRGSCLAIFAFVDRADFLERFPSSDPPLSILEHLGINPKSYCRIARGD